MYVAFDGVIKLWHVLFHSSDDRLSTSEDIDDIKLNPLSKKSTKLLTEYLVLVDAAK